MSNDRQLGKGKAMDAESHHRKVIFATFYAANPENAGLAYAAAGYSASNKGSERAAINRLLKDPVVLEVLHRQVIQPAIATREERQQWWTKLMRGGVPEATIQERIKASELLGKSQGDFTERVEIVSRSETLATVRGLLGLSGPPAPSYEAGKAPVKAPGSN